jgi:hypothetical protein
MVNRNTPFDAEYVGAGTPTTGGDGTSTPSSQTVVVETARYGIGKPKRVLIRTRIISDSDEPLRDTNGGERR